MDATAKDARPHEVLLCVQTGKTLADSALGSHRRPEWIDGRIWR
ncbi:hypothetical protein [Pseudonocardia cypriaca]|nr:hypothetical protein [Pseudonocardia cypriaca]